ncbi:MAG: lipopolysaccharide transport periplasmic protein LptA [Pseudomonadota bacterium]
MFSNHRARQRNAMCALLLLSAASLALDEDRKQPIRVKADSAERDDRQEITRYTGDVVIDQGSLNIVAQEVTMFGSTNVSKIVATGTPARLRQRPQPDKGIVTARANQIEYTVASEVVTLQKNAYVEQDGTEVRGDEITYDMTRQIVRANGSSKTQGRVEIIIPPNENAAADSRPEAP